MIKQKSRKDDFEDDLVSEDKEEEEEEDEENYEQDEDIIPQTKKFVRSTNSPKLNPNSPKPENKQLKEVYVAIHSPETHGILNSLTNKVIANDIWDMLTIIKNDLEEIKQGLL